MARALRIEFPGALFHVMSRGNERRAIVRDDSDRRRRIDWLERTVRTYGWKLHAFVLLTNHDHLFLDTPWPLGSRADDASRAITAYLARRRYGYPAKTVAATLGYAHPSSVSHAVHRIEAGSAKLQETAKRLEQRLKGG